MRNAYNATKITLMSESLRKSKKEEKKENVTKGRAADDIISFKNNRSNGIDQPKNIAHAFTQANKRKKNKKETDEKNQIQKSTKSDKQSEDTDE